MRLSNTITSKQIYSQIEQLSSQQKKEIYDFIFFVLNRDATRNVDKKQVLLNTSVWSLEDVQPIYEVQQELNQWKIPTL